MNMEYLAFLYKDENGGYTVEVPDLPGCLTQGESVEEAVRMAKDAALCWLSEGSIPEPSSIVDMNSYKDAAYVFRVGITWYELQKARIRQKA